MLALSSTQTMNQEDQEDLSAALSLMDVNGPAHELRHGTPAEERILLLKFTGNGPFDGLGVDLRLTIFAFCNF